MCTVVILRRIDHDWPILIAANRDEMADRPWLPPGRHWLDRAEVTAGLDRLAGGAWLGINDWGVVSGILNRRNSLGPDPKLRSRGEIVLEALDHADARLAAQALAALDGRSYRSFNMFIADNRDAYWVRSLGPDSDRRVEVMDIPEGLSMITSADRNDLGSSRIRLYLPQFARTAPPDPEKDDWLGWERLLAAREAVPGGEPAEAMNIVTERGFGTLSSSLIALPSIERVGAGGRAIWKFAAGRPDDAPFVAVDLGGRAPVQG